MNGLYRPHGNRMIAGVCAGLGRRFGMSANTVRLLFALSCLLPGPQFVVYIVLWVMMPNEERHLAGTR
ncbi:PspC domain-containing protein [Actinomadura sp. 7K507]|uniref:PspC domain-containing protein n=1 Tax=Actinomadura sp. 7K507 TaxID=2530365 RepID=UPI001053FF90|nr:PspC domain-containing protein [Actinomadura sp. 7K507]TDC83956.1 PspC domain-containing protein [Actinomadura sp. 7K507]